MGWRDWRTVEGSEVVSLSSWSRRLVDGGVREREEGAIMGERFDVMRLELKLNGQGRRWGMFTDASFSQGHGSCSCSGGQDPGIFAPGDAAFAECSAGHGGLGRGEMQNLPQVIDTDNPQSL